MGQPQLKEKPDRTREAGPEATRAAEAAHARSIKPSGLSRWGWAVLAGVILVLNLPLVHRAFRGAQPATATVPYSDDFADPSTVSRNYWTTGGHWRVVSGELLAPGVKNNPLWLQARLPRDVAVEFDARSESPEGDLKVEIFGDGLNHASGYVLIHGGWNNRLSVIARLDEHGTSLNDLRQKAQRVASAKGLPNADLVQTGVFRPRTHMRVEANPYPAQPGKTYHWRIERRGSLLRWSIDGELFLELDDPFPLEGKGHDRFGFSAWEAQLYFDNLRIVPL
jgi:hypothetical protein